MQDHTTNTNAGDSVFETEFGRYDTRDAGLAARVLEAWRDMRTSTRRLIGENPSEARLLFLVLMSDLIFFLSWSLKTIVSPTEAAQSILPAEVGLWLVVALFLRTSALYLFATLTGLVLRLAGGQGSYKDTRAAVFWGAFAAAPFGLLFALVTVLFAALEGVMPFLANDLVAQAPYWMSLIPFVWLIAAGLAEAHGHRRTAPMFMIFTLLTMIAWIGGLYLRAINVI